MPSVVEISNKALNKLGHGPITSLADGTKAANLCSRNWEQIRDQVLRDHPWNFAVKRAALAADSTPPAWGFGQQFPLPADCLRLLEIDGYEKTEWQLEGRSILANDTVLRIRYVARITDPNVYDVMFVDAVATRLAMELCEPLTQSNQKIQALAELYDDSLTRAKRVDAQENPPARFEEDDWVLVRY